MALSRGATIRRMQVGSVGFVVNLGTRWWMVDRDGMFVRVYPLKAEVAGALRVSLRDVPASHREYFRGFLIGLRQPR